MKLGFIGLGKMGQGLVEQLLKTNVDVVAYNRTESTTDEVVKLGASKASSIEDLCQQLGEHKIVWLMLPAGKVTRDMALKVAGYMSQGDIIIDGANSHYKETLRLKDELERSNIRLVDAGISGGPGGAKSGACVMVGGEKELIKQLEPIFKVISAPQAYLHCGDTGAGHFVKMVHNGIEYGMMQAIAEGAAVLKASPFKLDLTQVFNLYNHASVIESRLIGWTESALSKDPNLENISSTIAASGEGEWTIEAAKDLGVTVPVIQASFQVRLNSGNEPENFRNKIVSALRGEFGGHPVEKS